MDISLEKIDLVMARTDADFREAKEALEKNQGDVIEAIAYLEENKKDTIRDMGSKGEEAVDNIINKLKELVKEGNVTKIYVKKDGKTYLNIPVTFAAIGTILALKPVLLGLGLAFVTGCSIEVEKDDGEIININNQIEDKLEDEEKED